MADKKFTVEKFSGERSTHEGFELKVEHGILFILTVTKQVVAAFAPNYWVAVSEVPKT